MPPRLLPSSFSSFIAFYSCSLPTHLSRNYAVPLVRAHCLHTSPKSRVKRRGYAPILTPKRFFHASSSHSAQKDPYKVLSVKKDATSAEIKKAYFALARKYHPDTNPDKGAREKFVEIQQAYDILKDDEKRASYDRFGSASQEGGFDPNAFQGFGAGFAGGSAHTFDDLAGAFGSGMFGRRGQSDLFEQLFGAFGGGRGRGGGSSKGADLETSINIEFLDACKGTNLKVNIHPIVNCGTCSGSGLKQGAKRTTCTTCGGSGTRTFVIDSGFQMQSTCSSCDGVGSTIPRSGQCSSCSGVGKVRMKKTVDVTVPPGVEDGMTIRVSNQGDAPISGKGSSGDLLVRINVVPSKMFNRQGNNLYHEARIPLHTALLGGRVRVPTLTGNVEVRVPAGTQQGEEMILKGRGVPRVTGGDNGDLFVAFSVVLPRTLSPRQKELLQAYADDVEGIKSTERTSEGPPSSRSSEELLENDDNGSTAENEEKEKEKSGKAAEKKRATA